MTFDPSLYHPEWQSVRRQILDQADHRCEWCGAPNRETGDHDNSGKWWSTDDIVSMFGVDGEDIYETFPRSSKLVTIVLTTAHLCHDKMCIDPTHLRALCQRDHLALDRPHHLVLQAENRRKRRIAAGQRELV